MDYPRYKPTRERPPGMGAFFDYATGVASREDAKLKSRSLKRCGKNAPEAQATVGEEDVEALTRS